MAQILSGDMSSIVCKENGKIYRFEPKANETFNVDIGGIRNNDDANQKGTQGTLLVQKNTFRGKIDGPILYSKQSYEDLVKLAESPFEQEWQFSHINGTQYVSVGGGVVVGDIQGDSNAGTIALTIAASKFRVI